MSKGNKRRRRELGLLPEPVRCAARRTNGEPCRKWAINGGAVCATHGGSAPQVVRKARERLALAADDAVSVLVRMLSDSAVSASDRRQAATAILDRAGISTRAELEITLGPTYADIIQGIVSEVPEGEITIGPGDYTGYKAMNGLVPVDNVVEAVVISEDPA